MNGLLLLAQVYYCTAESYHKEQVLAPMKQLPLASVEPHRDEEAAFE